MAFNWPPVYNQVKDSIFTVLLTPSDRDVHATMLKEIAEAANTVQDVGRLDEILKSSISTTGFSIGVRAGVIGILTCAHSLDHLFSASRPLSVHQISRLFTVRVRCSHQENGLLAAGNAPGAQIHYATASVFSIDCRRDLMLVTTPLTSLRDCWGAQCLAPHPGLPICPDGGLDPSTSECLLVSWPSFKPDLMTLGHISRSRRLKHIWQNDEYDFEALEVQMMVGKGSSGGPLVNRIGEVIGVLHCHDDTHSYFVSFRHVREFLPIVV